MDVEIPETQQSRCFHCGRAAASQCSRCRLVKYWSGACQQKDWRAGHKVQCGKQDILNYTIDDLISEFELQQDSKTAKQNTWANPVAFTLQAPDGGVQCILAPRYKEKMLTIPDFPRPIFTPEVPRHSVTPCDCGKHINLHALRDINPGECVFAERPLLLTSPMVHCPKPTKEHDISKMFPARLMTASDHRFSLMEFYDRVYYEDAINGGSMDPAKREAYLAFTTPKMSKGDTGRLVDRFSHNAIPATKRPDPEGKKFYGICEKLSRIKQSCSPNCYISFDIPTLSFKLWALRRIRRDEEITISRVSIDMEEKERDKQLYQLYGVECPCAACREPEASDKRRALAMNDPTLRLPEEIEEWCTSTRLPNDLYSKRGIQKLRRMEAEGLEGSDAYLITLTYMMRSHLALGELALAKAVQQRIIGLSHDFLGREETWDGKVGLVKSLGEARNLTRLSFWRARVEKRVPLKFMPIPKPPVPSFSGHVCPHGLLV